MSNDIQVFEKAEFGTVRTFMINNKPWFVGVDVARALGYSDPSATITKLCKGVAKMAIPSNGGKQETNVIPEADLYRLVLKSNLPSAEKFQDWVCEEVIPSIMKHGMYATPATIDNILADPDTFITLLQQYKETKAKVAQLQHEKNLLEDKVEETQADIAGLVEDLRYNRDYCTVLQWDHLREFFDPNDGKATNKIGRVLSEIGNQIGNPPIPVKSQGFHFPIKAHHKDAWAIFLRRLQSRPNYMAEYRIDYMAGNIDRALHA